MKDLTVLDEANVGALLTEALTADVEAVLADQTSRVGADAAVSTVLAIGTWKPCTVASKSVQSAPSRETNTVRIVLIQRIYNLGPPAKYREFQTYHSREPLP
jgi:hypothetical protein